MALAIISFSSSDPKGEKKEILTILKHNQIIYIPFPPAIGGGKDIIN
jgi:hypothetical protein